MPSVRKNTANTPGSSTKFILRMKAELYKNLRQSERYMEMLEAGIKTLSDLMETFEIVNETRANIIAQAHGSLTVELNTEKGNYKNLIHQLSEDHGAN